ncbi:ThuA domain-containing protein [Anatilimnocola floriformis]|uniref:ThuA domain-containing protein n=1 Tax=Anatilimnocola floriformis TaxID=2948575 RepID=UPI0020C3F3F5|nr:ThuA domain-containing protein [Anatilimnocola floriformis]
MSIRAIIGFLFAVALWSGLQPAATSAVEPRRLLLLSQGPDGHPVTTHEYVAGQQILARLLRDVPDLLITQVKADVDWKDGPAVLDKTDHCVLFVSEGAKWVNSDPARREAFRRLAGRKGGLSVLHWGMGTKEAENIDVFVQLFGACHGGPDRKYKVLEAQCTPASDHPATAGMQPFKQKDEFYYAFKQDPNQELKSLLTARIDDREEMIAWAWQRKDGGRSFGFSGLHFHANWKQPEYQRLVAQSVLWTTQLPQPKEFPAKLTDADFQLPDSPKK